MAEYSNLSATINAQIRANGVQAITGPVLNAVLTAMVNVLGDGYRLNGVAVPADNPGSPDNRVAYLAAQDGTYTNFGGLTISGEVALLLWDSAWTKETLFSIDTAVTPGSGNLVTSGAVDSALTTLANNIAAAYMQLVPGATEDNLASYDNAGQVKDSGIAAADVVVKDGVCPDLFAGFAGNLVDTRSAGTPQGPYAFRRSGGDGVDYMVRIKGKTEAWNQLVAIPGSSQSKTQNGVTFVDNRDGSYTISTAEGGATQDEYLALTSPTIEGHKYLLIGCPKGGSTSTYYLRYYRAGRDIGDGSIFDSINEAATGYPRISVISGTIISTPITFRPQLIDLTLMFGAGNEPATVAEFQSLHPLPYYNYNAGVLKNNAATGIKSRGFNQWDEEWEEGAYNTTTGEKSTSSTSFRSKNFIPIIKDALYYINFARTNYANDSEICVLQYDANKSLITYGYYPVAGIKALNSECAFLSFFVLNATTYNHDICINLSDASRNGEYEPYWERTLALGLNSIACHDENNNAVVVNGLDGVETSQDEAYGSNGYLTHINKKMEEVDLGDLEWTKQESETRGIVFRANLLDAKSTGNGISNKYIITTQVNDITLSADKIGVIAPLFTSNMQINIKDSAYSSGTAESFKSAMQGVKLRYELATPKVLTVDNPIPALIEVDNLGTQERLPADTADNPQGGFESDSNYSVSTANLVRLLGL